jgi:hypothetical protein
MWQTQHMMLKHLVGTVTSVLKNCFKGRASHMFKQYLRGPSLKCVFLCIDSKYIFTVHVL